MQKSKIVTLKEKSFLLTIYLDSFNKRIRIDDYLGNMDDIIARCHTIANEQNAEKIIFKTRAEHFSKLIANGYRVEGLIDGYFRGSDCLFFSKYLTNSRMTNINWIKEDEILQNVLSREKEASASSHLLSSYKFKKLAHRDADILAKLYNQIFQIYPTPLNDPDYIRETMNTGTIYFGFENNGELVSAASAEVNSFYMNAELTDCATLKEHRKYGLMKLLLLELEKELEIRGIYCAYSIARSLSYGMNAVLYQLGYEYRGRLINNCFIYDKLEDMNVWVRHLGEKN